jgi:hypothetical protein
MPAEFYRKEDISMTFADDLTQGKFSFPLVHAIDSMKNEEVYGKKFYLFYFKLFLTPLQKS